MKAILFILLFGVISLSASSQISALEQAFIDEVNLVRTQPKAYIEHLKVYSETEEISKFEISLIENELITLLDTMIPVPALIASSDIRKRQEKFKSFSKKTGMAWHQNDYMRNSRWKASGQNLASADEGEVRNVVIRLLIDRCVADRGHRIAMLSPLFTHTAVREIKLGDKKDYQYGEIWWLQDFGTEEYISGFPKLKRYKIDPSCSKLKS
jgi:hypothetical protein